MARLLLTLSLLVTFGCATLAADPEPSPAPPPAPPATRPAGGKLQHVQVDVKKKQVRVECESVAAEMPIEFFLCANNTQEHETVLRSLAKASAINLALLMCGLEPGEPVHYSESTKKWLPPHGPPLQMFCEYEKGNRVVSIPAYRMMRDVKTKKEPAAFTWVFAGSRILDNNTFAADVTGYLVSVVNFDLTLIDIPELASSANETLEWEVNPDTTPPRGTKVTLVIEPAGNKAPKDPATQPASTDDPGASAPIDVSLVTVDAAGKVELNRAPVTTDELTAMLQKMKRTQPVKVRLMADKAADLATIASVANAIKTADVPVEIGTRDSVADPAAQPTTHISDVSIDEAKIRAMRKLWEQAVAPHRRELAEAANTHYKVISTLRREQQRLIDESDRIQRLIDQLEKEYQDMTTPRPESADQ